MLIILQHADMRTRVLGGSTQPLCATAGAGGRWSCHCGGASHGGLGRGVLCDAGHWPGRGQGGPRWRRAARRLRLLHERRAGLGRHLPCTCTCKCDGSHAREAKLRHSWPATLLERRAATLLPACPPQRESAMPAEQVVGSFSRVGLSLYTYVPPNQTGTFSDTGALNRAVQRPANAFDAFRRAAEEGCSGLWSAVSGLIMDPTQVHFDLGHLQASCRVTCKHAPQRMDRGARGLAAGLGPCSQVLRPAASVPVPHPMVSSLAAHVRPWAHIHGQSGLPELPGLKTAAPPQQLGLLNNVAGLPQRRPSAGDAGPGQGHCGAGRAADDGAAGDDEQGHLRHGPGLPRARGHLGQHSPPRARPRRPGRRFDRGDCCGRCSWPAFSGH